jgi:hypothetical protein
VPANGDSIGDVVLEIGIRHTWVGDLRARLDYDENSDGTTDVSCTFLCRPGRPVPCDSAGTGVGCSSRLACDLGATYLFDDATSSTMPVSNCTSARTIEAGCYKPTGIGAGRLSVFEHHLQGGRWTLFVSDNAAEDTGALCQWAVHVKNAPLVALTPVSWGQMKRLFR